MYVLISNSEKSPCIAFPWEMELTCRKYKTEDAVFTLEQFYGFLESLNGDFSSIQGLVILSPLKNYEFISECTQINQLFIYDSKTEIEINLSGLINLKQLVIACKKFKGDSIFYLLDNKIKNEQGFKEDNAKFSKHTILDMFIREIDITQKEIDLIRKVLLGEVIINSYILGGRRDKYIERQKYIEKNKNRVNRFSSRQERKAYIKKCWVNLKIGGEIYFIRLTPFILKLKKYLSLEENRYDKLL